MPAVRRPGVFCVEGDWSSKLTDRSSVQPLLRALEGLNVVKVIHRSAGTRTELEHLLKRWVQKQYDDYMLGYLAFHGSPGLVHLGRDSVSLEELGELLEGACTGRVLHFGSCSVLKSAETSLKAFLHQTGARAVCGYTKDVDWLQSAAFDLLLISELVRSQHLGYAARRVKNTYPDLASVLGFRLVTVGGQHPDEN